MLRLPHTQLKQIWLPKISFFSKCMKLNILFFFCFNAFLNLSYISTVMSKFDKQKLLNVKMKIFEAVFLSYAIHFN